MFEGNLLVYENGWAFRSIHLGQLEYSISEFFKIEQHSSEAISFFTETLQLLIKVPNRSSQVLASIWKIEQTDLLPPEYPTPKKIELSTDSETIHEHDTKAIPIHLIIGVAGSGKTKAAKDISRGIRIDCIIPSLDQSSHFDQKY